jgi:hypothetical protein
VSKTSAQPSVERRISPAGRSLHFFGITNGDVAGRKFQVGGERASAIGFGRLSLLVRYVPQEEWGGELLERRRSDETWFLGQAALHERVLERAMMRGAVIPAEMLTIFPRLDDLEDAARGNYERWRRLLSRLAGKEEWTMHVFHGPHLLKRERVPYMLRTIPATSRPGKLRVPEIDAHVTAHLSQMWKACSGVASAARQIQARGGPKQVFGAAFLIGSARVEAFKETLEQLNGDARRLGLAYYLEGPKPPYTFV